MKSRYTPKARADLQEIHNYIASDNPAAARRVRSAIRAAVQFLAQQPYAGTVNARAPELRSWPVDRYPYRVHYEIRGSELAILHIRHAARRPWP